MEADNRQVTRLHSPTVTPPSALDKPSIRERYHRRRTCSHTSSRRSPTMVTLHDTRFVECRLWKNGYNNKNNNSRIQRRNSRFFFNLLTAPRTVSNTHSGCPDSIVCKSRATHRAPITCNISCYMPRGRKGQLSCYELKSHLLELSLIG